MPSRCTFMSELPKRGEDEGLNPQSATTTVTDSSFSGN
jgi:hypothetical protein